MTKFKTALELLEGDSGPVHKNFERTWLVGRLFPGYIEDWLELVAERAREEMREACAAALDADASGIEEIVGEPQTPLLESTKRLIERAYCLRSAAGQIRRFLPVRP